MHSLFNLAIITTYVLFLIFSSPSNTTFKIQLFGTFAIVNKIKEKKNCSYCLPLQKCCGLCNFIFDLIESQSQGEGVVYIE